MVKGMKTENPRVMEAMEPEAESTYNIEEIGEGEYFILDSSGLNKKIPKQREETNPAIQEPYSYFDFKKIWESLKFSEKVLKKGKQLLENDGVELEETSLGYMSDEDEQVAIAEGTGWERNQRFPIKIIFSRTEILHVGCQFSECWGNYWRYSGREYCAYTYAMIKLAENQLQSDSAGSATDKRGNRILMAFRQNQANQVISGVIGQNVRVMLIPRLIEKDGGLALSFKIGTKKLYVIKDLQEFYISVKMSVTQIYGADTEIYHAIDNFTEMGKRWIAFIGDVVQEEARFEERLIKSRTYSKKALTKKNELE